MTGSISSEWGIGRPQNGHAEVHNRPDRFAQTAVSFFCLAYGLRSECLPRTPMASGPPANSAPETRCSIRPRDQVFSSPSFRRRVSGRPTSATSAAHIRRLGALAAAKRSHSRQGRLRAIPGGSRGAGTAGAATPPIQAIEPPASSESHHSQSVASASRERGSPVHLRGPSMPPSPPAPRSTGPVCLPGGSLRPHRPFGDGGCQVAVAHSGTVGFFGQSSPSAGRARARLRCLGRGCTPRRGDRGVVRF